MEAIVDRIEGQIAVLEIDGEHYRNVPLEQLPRGTQQGDVLTGPDGSMPEHWTRDDARRAERLAQNQTLMDELFED
jgi:hypothetical protein